jgi:hypothetical protein
VAPEARSWAALGGREAVAERASSDGWRWGTELTAGAVSACGGSEASGLAGPKVEWAARSAGLKVGKKILN